MIFLFNCFVFTFKVMNYFIKSVGKRDALLVVFYIKRSQVIETQECIRVSKPQENTLF